MTAPSNPAERAVAPWRFTSSLCESVWIYEGNELIAELIDGPETHAKAALIVRAVNAHDDLVAALKVALPYVEKYAGEDWIPEDKAVQCRAALAKAERSVA